MKKLLLFLFALISFAGMHAKTHTVARGESLQSIAQSYGISVDELLVANQDAGQLFFVGLKLEIPEKQTSAGTAVTPVLEPAENGVGSNVPDKELSEETSGKNIGSSSLRASAQNELEPASSDISEKRPGWDVLTEVDFGFLPSVDGVENDFNFTLGVSIGASYWFTNQQSGAFAAVSAGFMTSNSGYKMKEMQITQTSDMYIVNLPIKFGFKINILEDRLHLTPYAGLDLGMTVGGSSELRMGTQKTKYKVDTGKFVTGLRFGAQIGLGHAFGLGGYYVIPLGDTAKSAYGKDGHFSLCMTFGF